MEEKEVVVKETTKEEIDKTVDAVKEIVEKLRGMSVLYEEFLQKHSENKK